MIELLKTKHYVQLFVPLFDLTVTGLKAECKLRQFDTKGKKFALITRLLQKEINETTAKAAWKKQKTQNAPSSFSHPIKLNENEFLVMTKTKTDTTSSKLSIYNIPNNKWRDFNWGWNYSASDYVSACLNDTGDILYVLLKSNNLLIHNLKDNNTQKWDNVVTSPFPAWYTMSVDGSMLVFANKELHLFGGYTGEQHLIWNESTHKFDIEHHRFSTALQFDLAGLIHVRARNMILVIGGARNASRWSSVYKRIWSYNTLTKKWCKFQMELPLKLCKFGYAVTGCERYILILGGETRTDWRVRIMDGIYILDLEKMEMRASIISCPRRSGNYCGSIMNNGRARNLIVFGFVRDLWKKETFNKAMRYPPDYIIRLILSWFMYESLHLLETANSDKNDNHWIIDTDFIIDNSQLL